jgi:VanZ family protein
MTHLSGHTGLFFVALVILAYVALALAPFRWAPPHRLPNAAMVDGDGLRFPAPGLLRTREAPAWLAQARDLGSVRLQFRLRGYSPEQGGPARIFTVSRDVHLANLILGQEGPDLVLRLRRPSSTPAGKPPYTIPGVFRDSGWHEVDIAIKPGSLRVEVDGRVALATELPERPLAGWDRRYLVALGNEVNGLHPWRGEVARAVVELGRERLDYASLEHLELPGQFWVFANRLTKLSRDDLDPPAIADWIANFVSFIPLGFFLGALGGKHGSWRRAFAICALASLLVEIAQFFFSRHPSVPDLILNTIGGATGAGIARWLVGRAFADVAGAPDPFSGDLPR